MNKPFNYALAALAAVLALAPVLSAAQGKEMPGAADAPALDEIDCRTLLRLGSDERSFTILYFHGYVSGLRGQKRLTTRALAEDTDRVIDQCIEKPAEKLLAVFERVRAK